MDATTQIPVLLVDDEAEIRSAVRELLADYEDFRIVGEAECKSDALALLREHPVSVIFSDIQMEGGSGFELAEMVHRLYPDILVVFLTGYTDFALDGYRYGPVDFLVKPVSRERLEQTLERIRGRLLRERKPESVPRIGLQTGSGYHIVDVRAIAYLEKEDRRVKIFWKDGSSDYVARTMQELEEILLDHDFFRCHQSYLVPLRDIQRIQKESFGRSYKICLSGGLSLPLSRQKYYMLRDILSERGIQQLQ